MSRSDLVLSAAEKAPWLFRPVIRAACQVHVWTGSRPHWLVLRLKDKLGLRLSQRLSIDGFIMEVDPLDGPGSGLRQHGLTEPETRALFSEMLRPGMIVLDVGAYIGQFSLVAFRAMNGVGTIVAFEPTASVFAQLRRNLELNGCDIVNPLQMAVSDREGSTTFYVYGGSNDQSSLFASVPGEEGVPQQVQVTTLDATVERLGLPAVHLIKIDVEGNELAALAGSQQILRRFRPALIVEISRHQLRVGYSGAAIKEMLNRFDYDVFRLDGMRRPYQFTEGEINADVSHFNVLALPRG